MILDKAVISVILQEYNRQEDKTLLSFRNIVQKHISLNDEIKAEDVISFERLAFKLYKKNDFGKFGKHDESVERIDLLILNGANTIPWYEFFAHEQGVDDYVDTFEEKRFEHKTGQGDWMVSKQPDFLTCVEEYKQSGKYIKWNFKKYDIRMCYTFPEFFEILENYNPKKGLSTWFTKETGKRAKGIKNQYKWKMQSLANSEKKVAYLRQFNNF